MQDAAPLAPSERGWGKLLLALAAFLFLPLMPPFRALLPVEETLVLLLPALAACCVVGWWAGGRFALAVIGNPDVLFLDEPTAALDVEARRGFWEQVGMFTRSGKTIILTTHYLEEADAIAERIVVINAGEIVAQGTPAAIKARVGGKVVRFKSPRLEAAMLEKLPITRSSINAESVELYTLEPEQVLRELFARNIPISDLEVRGGGLEEAFVQITNLAQA